MSRFEDGTPIIPDGVSIRRIRRDHGWSRKVMVRRIAEATERESGIRQSISQNLLEGIEEGNERIPYSVLCMVATGLDLNPIEILLEPEDEEPHGHGGRGRPES